jgi:hypothetical protein
MIRVPVCGGSGGSVIVQNFLFVCVFDQAFFADQH